jgi:hypothetical protein
VADKKPCNLCQKKSNLDINNYRFVLIFRFYKNKKKQNLDGDDPSIYGLSGVMEAGLKVEFPEFTKRDYFFFIIYTWIDIFTTIISD